MGKLFPIRQHPERRQGSATNNDPPSNQRSEHGDDDHVVDHNSIAIGRPIGFVDRGIVHYVAPEHEDCSNILTHSIVAEQNDLCDLMENEEAGQYFGPQGEAIVPESLEDHELVQYFSKIVDQTPFDHSSLMGGCWAPAGTHGSMPSMLPGGVGGNGTLVVPTSDENATSKTLANQDDGVEEIIQTENKEMPSGSSADGGKQRCGNQEVKAFLEKSDEHQQDTKKNEELDAVSHEDVETPAFQVVPISDMKKTSSKSWSEDSEHGVTQKTLDAVKATPNWGRRNWHWDAGNEQWVWTQQKHREDDEWKHQKEVNDIENEKQEHQGHDKKDTNWCDEGNDESQGSHTTTSDHDGGPSSPATTSDGAGSPVQQHYVPNKSLQQSQVSGERTRRRKLGNHLRHTPKASANKRLFLKEPVSRFSQKLSAAPHVVNRNSRSIM